MKNNKKKSFFSTRNIIIGLVGIVVILVVLSLTGVFENKSIQEVEVDKITRRDILETVSANGKLQPETEVKISADISGEIIELPIKEGDKVKKGQLLCRIKPDQYQRELERSLANVNNIKANLSTAKAQAEQSFASFQKNKLQFERNKKLYDQKVISQSEFENYNSEYEVAKAQYQAALESVKAAEFNLQSSQATYKESEYSLTKTSIYSPMDGTISRLNVELGERVVGTMQMAGTEMMRVANLSVMESEVEVNENDIPNLMLNDTADIEVDAFRGDVFKGIVTSIANSSGADATASSTDKVTNFKVKIRLLEKSYADKLKDIPNNHGTPFKPGMNCSVNIHTKEAKNVISVPVLAITMREPTEPQKTPTSGKKNSDNATSDEKKSELKEVVFIYKSGKVYQKEVKSGLQNSDFIELKNGLKGDEQIVVGPFNAVSKLLNDGMEVKIAKKGDANQSGVSISIGK